MFQSQTRLRSTQVQHFRTPTRLKKLLWAMATAWTVNRQDAEELYGGFCRIILPRLERDLSDRTPPERVTPETVAFYMAAEQEFILVVENITRVSQSQLNAFYRGTKRGPVYYGPTWDALLMSPAGQAAWADLDQVEKAILFHHDIVTHYGDPGLALVAASATPTEMLQALGRFIDRLQQAL
jgi:hypothetical protein